MGAKAALLRQILVYPNGHGIDIDHVYAVHALGQLSGERKDAARPTAGRHLSIHLPTHSQPIRTDQKHRCNHQERGRDHPEYRVRSGTERATTGLAYTILVSHI